MTVAIGRSNSGTAADPWQVANDSPCSLLEVATVWDKNNSSTCGHTLPLDKLMDRIHADCLTCPVCQQSFAIVRDGAVGNPSYPTVTLKYGKLIYEVSLPSSKKGNNNSWWLFSLGSSHDDKEETAQARIAHVLGLQLNEMKILCKGRVLYPTTNMGDDALRDVLLEQKPVHGKPHLLVMGTIADQQLPKQSSSSNNKTTTGWWNQLLSLSQTVVISTLSVSVSVLLSVLQSVYSFATTPLLRRSSSDNNNEPATSSARRQQHQD